MKLYLGPERREIERRSLTISETFRTVVRRMWHLIAYSDTTQTRFFLALVSTLWTLALLMPGDSFARPTFLYMSELAGDHAEEKWTVVFAIYAVAAFWKVFSTNSVKIVAILINAFGVTLFVSIAVSVLSLNRDPFPAGAAAHLGVALAAVWVLVRTHVNSALGWRHD